MFADDFEVGDQMVGRIGAAATGRGGYGQRPAGRLKRRGRARDRTAFGAGVAIRCLGRRGGRRSAGRPSCRLPRRRSNGRRRRRACGRRRDGTISGRVFIETLVSMLFHKRQAWPVRSPQPTARKADSARHMIVTIRMHFMPGFHLTFLTGVFGLFCNASFERAGSAPKTPGLDIWPIDEIRHDPYLLNRCNLQRCALYVSKRWSQRSNGMILEERTLEGARTAHRFLALRQRRPWD